MTLDALTNDVDCAIREASNTFEIDFLSDYVKKYSQNLICDTTALAKELANDLPENAEYLLGTLAKDDEAKREDLAALIEQAFAVGRGSFGTIRERLASLRELFPRFREIVLSGNGLKIGSVIIGALTGGAMAWLGISSFFLISQASRFTASKWSKWRGKDNEQFGDHFVNTLLEVQNSCDTLNLSVGRSLDTALEKYCQYRRDYYVSVVNVLTEISRAGWNVRPAIDTLRARLIRK